MNVQVLVGDALDVLRGLPANSFQTCVTSPPYFGLRDYGVAGQIGLEQTPDAYVAEMVAVFREVRRVLRPDGTCWLNIGDSYSVKHVGRRDHGAAHPTSRLGPARDGIPGGTRIPASGNWLVPGAKPKDLLMIPARVALALQADGWWIRSDIIWHKPNPMPESVRDRPTQAHEHVFLLTKEERYFFDAEAIREPLVTPPQDGILLGKKGRGKSSSGHATAVGTHGPSLRGEGRCGENPAGRNSRNVWTITPQPFKGAHFATMPPALVEKCILAGSRPGDAVLDPFFGAGTTGLVAQRLGRSCTGIELNPGYAEMARARIAADDGPRKPKARKARAEESPGLPLLLAAE